MGMLDMFKSSGEEKTLEAAKKFNADMEAKRQVAEKTKGTTENKLGESTGPFEDLTDEEIEKSTRTGNISVENPMEDASEEEIKAALDKGFQDRKEK